MALFFLRVSVLCCWSSLGSTLDKEETTIAFFGGSMVVGISCDQPEFGMTLQKCAYPARIQRKLSELVGNRKLQVLNQAVGGSTTGGYLPSLPIVLKELDKRPSAVFIDYSVNDALEVCMCCMCCLCCLSNIH